MARAYRKKPVTVEAIQWTGENHAEVCEFIDPEMFEIIPRVGLVIHTLESCKQKSSPEMKKAPQFSQSKNGYSKADRRRIPSPTWIE